jgi:hypothetical protein
MTIQGNLGFYDWDFQTVPLPTRRMSFRDDILSVARKVPTIPSSWQRCIARV